MFRKLAGVLGMLVTSLAVNAQQNILIYSGPGAGELSVANTLTTIKQLVGDKYNVITVGPKVLIDDAWLENTALLIMPGGADRPYLTKLKGIGNANIRRFVENGGKYIGICAGAYYSADRIEFVTDYGLEVVAERELKFYPGLIKGPTYAGYDHRNVAGYAGARAETISWQATDQLALGENFTVFYYGGGSFIAAENYPSVTILAKYQQNGPVAIVECLVGKGKAILSSPHFEWDPETLEQNSPQICDITPKLRAGNKKRLLLAKHLIQRLGL